LTHHDLQHTVTKTDIIDQIAAGTGLTRIETEAVVNGFLSVVTEALEAGEDVELRGFGAFRVQPRKARVARNPQTNEEVEIEARYVPVFKPSRDFRDGVDAAAKRRKPGR
jgi:nucleoid DNA-binding protein